jgi:hypothetical protein
MRVGRLTAILAAAAIASAGTIAGAGQAQAARSTCYASSCNHLNPYKTTCTGDAFHIDPAYDSNGAAVYLYYSPSCRAVWAEAWNARPNTHISVHRRGGSLYSEDWATSDPHTWTGMINDAGYKAYAEICPPNNASVSFCGQTSDY